MLVLLSFSVFDMPYCQSFSFFSRYCLSDMKHFWQRGRKKQSQAKVALPPFSLSYLKLQHPNTNRSTTFLRPCFFSNGGMIRRGNVSSKGLFEVPGVVIKTGFLWGSGEGFAPGIMTAVQFRWVGVAFSFCQVVAKLSHCRK